MPCQISSRLIIPFALFMLLMTKGEAERTEALNKIAPILNILNINYDPVEIQSRSNAVMRILSQDKREDEDLCGSRRERKEVRMMSRDEWKNYTDAVNALKTKGLFDIVATIHRGETRLEAAHAGANFLGWHRIFLLMFEELLRKEQPCITLPYWDSSLDYDMEDPTSSVVWTDTFFGNGDYQVTIGPFANWVTGLGDNLTRNIGSFGSLIPKEGVSKVLSRKNHAEILSDYDREYSIEQYSNAVHVWVGGQMSELDEAAEDPVFYNHYAFIDCWWQWFQEKIYNESGIDSYNDYPIQNNPMHYPDRKMDPFATMLAFKNIRNRDGYLHKYKDMYICNPSPTCTAEKPDCGSPYLICNTTANRCMSKAGFQPFGIRPFGSRPAIRHGPKFVAKTVDKRTRGDPLSQLLPSIDRDSKEMDQSVSDISSVLN